MIGGMTRAVVATAYGGPEVLDVIDVPLDPLRPGEVLLDVRAAGVNPADWKQYSGAWGTDPAQLPMRLGHEAAGVIAAVADEPDDDSMTVGAEVIAFHAPGAYADQIVVPRSAVLRKPGAMSWEKAAGLMVSGVAAVHTLAATRVGAGDTVLVHGASGGVGAMIVQLARARGARVIGTADPSNHEYLVDLGAVPVGYGPGLVDRVRAAAHGNLTAAIDVSGTREALDASVALVHDRRRVATIAGMGYGAQLGIKVLGNGPGADPGTEIRDAARATLIRLVEQGKVDVRVGATYQLGEAARAHRAGIEGRVQGKIILVPRDQGEGRQVQSRSLRRPLRGR
jgi:NADPH:quinone reductase-like Zn-dependent oxidoreductase